MYNSEWTSVNVTVLEGEADAAPPNFTNEGIFFLVLAVVLC